MFRLTHFMREALSPSAAPPRRGTGRPVVIWNLIRRCNLRCRHCYSISADHDFPGELTTPEIFAVLDDLRAFGVPALILSGGEPLLHPDIFAISERAKALGFFLALSSNGALIDEAMAARIAAIGYDYVGVSLDGVGATHDRFRGRPGAFAASTAGLRHLRALGVKAGLRFTLTADNQDELERLLDFADAQSLDKFYLSHLNYAGRGNKNRTDDTAAMATRRAMDLLIARCREGLEQGRPREYVTGNNDADGVYFLHWVERNFPARAARLRELLVAWGGNSSGRGVANIDNLGRVHPDTFWSHHTLGNVRERPFSAIWSDESDRVLAGLRRQPRPVTGRCAACAHLAICNANTRIRALQLTGDVWAEDPGCYLDDAEIGVAAAAPRVAVTAYRGARHAARH